MAHHHTGAAGGKGLGPGPNLPPFRRRDGESGAEEILKCLSMSETRTPVSRGGSLTLRKEACQCWLRGFCVHPPKLTSIQCSVNI